jgi:glutamate-5-semialdehyde dehydrogenase
MSADELVREAASRAHAAHPALLAAAPEALDAALTAAADLVERERGTLLDANAEDVAAARASSTASAMVDRLVLDEQRLLSLAGALRDLAALPHPPAGTPIRDLPEGLVVVERRVPVGVVGATYEARPNVTLDVASQLVKSRNAGVLRTGGAALRSAQAIVDRVVAPALAAAGLDREVIQLVRTADRAAAVALVSHPDLVPLVVVRGSGETTRALGREAARHGTRVLAHADGGGVLYAHRSADPATLQRLLRAGLDRLGVCNRLNLLLVDEGAWDSTVPAVTSVLADLGVTTSLPPHAHRLGHEWALDEGREATVTVAAVSGGPAAAARLADRETSGIAATVCAEDAAAAREFLAAWTGTGGFWNATTRLLDGAKLLGAPETGINVDRVPGPRGPVTFRDLALRQFVVAPRDVPFDWR